MNLEKRKQRRRYTWTMLALASLLMLAGCGSGGTTKTETIPNAMMEVTLQAPADWMEIRSSGGNFYASEGRKTMLFTNVADGYNEIPVTFEKIEDFQSASELFFVENISHFARGEISDNAVFEQKDKKELEVDGHKAIRTEGALRDDSLSVSYPYVSYFVDVTTDTVHRPTFWIVFGKDDNHKAVIDAADLVAQSIEVN